MNYKMSPKEYFSKIIELYRNAREPEYYNPNVLRGRSASISSGLEDLTAYFIALNNPNQCMYYVDQPIKFEGSTTKYPDVVIQNNNGVISNLIDVKTDIGWARDKMLSFCQEWESRIESIKGTKTTFKSGKDKSVMDGIFDINIKYHIFVISKINSGNKIDSDVDTVKETLKNVCLYLLSDKLHPNNYKHSPDETLDIIKINVEEFDRFFTHIV